MDLTLQADKLRLFGSLPLRAQNLILKCVVQLPRQAEACTVCTASLAHMANGESAFWTWRGNDRWSWGLSAAMVRILDAYMYAAPTNAKTPKLFFATFFRAYSNTSSCWSRCSPSLRNVDLKKYSNDASRTDQDARYLTMHHQLVLQTTLQA